ncbi:glutamine synthetase type III N terminal-domain-containing protein [Zopfochytrium polystomum]|nr:glutamine synthetase type III N terminal-domain-containing protein [Zopfochytrium polystomum]
MAQSARLSAYQETVHRPNRDITWPQVTASNGTIRNKYPSEVFGQDVFGTAALSNSLPKPVYNRFIQQIQGRQQLDRPTADAVAHAVRVWAMDRGATHFTHWFQPQTGTTAEKHDSFLTLKTTFVNGFEQTHAIDAFSGGQLLQSEPDASSFPNGGMRSTFEARGYTVWDTTSPMFIRRGPHGTAVLYIPSVFISYNGEALDEKTILLRSSEVLSNAAVRLLRALGDTETKRVSTTLGTEQEFFLIDRALYNLRPDLKITGRTLIGVPPPKHQQLEDHYFGQIPSRVLAAISEAEYELIKIGVPVKTRHNEVAPNQFEMAPIFEESSVAVDHNLVTMEVLHQVAHRHKLKVLFHEKPFKGVNGSGKHANWSMSTDAGDNLLDPTLKPETNYRFLLFLVATLDAVHKHGGLLRAGIASASNEHRLGANEAPPGIVSAFLGDHLNEVLNAIEENRSVKNFSRPHLQTVKVGGTVLDLKVSTLPTISRDLTDRNRTSPFAFTGNKFEFRAVGAKQSPSLPVVLLNSAVAASINAVTDALLAAKGSKPELTEDDILAVVKKFIKDSKNIRFEANNYSDDWVKEAERRGLPNIKSCPVAFKQLLEPKNRQLLTSLGIFTEDELNSRYHILVEKYAKDLLIEGNTLKNMITSGVLPGAYAYRKDLAESLNSQKNVGVDLSDAPELETLKTLTTLTADLKKAADHLQAVIDKVEALHDEEQGEVAGKELTAALEEVRSKSDTLEKHVADKYWPYPKYTELLF